MKRKILLYITMVFIIVIGLYSYFKSSTFEQVIQVDVEKINTIEISVENQVSDNVIIKNKKEIRRLYDYLDGVELKKHRGKPISYINGENENIYTLHILTGNRRVYIDLYEHNMFIFDYKENIEGNYRVLNRKLDKQLLTDFYGGNAH